MLNEIKEGIILAMPFLSFLALIFFGMSGVAICVISAISAYKGMTSLEVKKSHENKSKTLKSKVTRM